jgi:hypothetical protein
MPVQRKRRRSIPPSDRVLRPLARRPLSVDRVVELVDQLVTLEEISIETTTAELQPNPPPPPPIDPMMLPRGLPIVVP